MWYDLQKINISWEEAVTNLISVVNSKISTGKKIIACAMLRIAEVLETKVIVPLKELHQIYREECRGELLYAKLKEGENVRLADIALSNYHTLERIAEQGISEVEGLTENEVNACVHILNVLPMYKYKSSDFRDVIMGHLPVVLVYKVTDNNNSHACVVKRCSGIQWSKMIGSLDWPGRESVSKDLFSRRLQDLLKPALSFATEKDRHLLKLILSKLFSVQHLVEKGVGGVKFKRSSLKRNVLQTENSISSWLEQQSTATQAQKKEMRWKKGERLKGSGRLPLGTIYPELAGLMLSLFDTAAGLQSHPRLICETMFVHNTSYMNMPRCVSILQDVYNIDIALSTAYTYTDNFREKSYQAARHHHGQGLNPGICIRKPTRDGHAKEQSINDHFAQADVNYSLEEGFDSGAVVIARDDKALVHCDVEVVQRPSKSWKKVSYADHDWQKDTQRSLQITTYQFVKLKERKQEEVCAHLNGIPVCQSQLTGPAVSIVKIHYLESSTAFRHLNELLFLMTVEELRCHFIKGNGALASQFLLTVDGGPDERPRNKSTRFASVLLRKLLDLDKYKVISYAENASKRHSVERYHYAEGRALSQGGDISSKAVHADELSSVGMFDIEKFRGNMEHARSECISRIDGTPYAGECFLAVKPPSDDDWVISPAVVEQIEKFLCTDTTAHRISTNFVIRPEGALWQKLCSMYDLCPNKTFSAVSVYNDANDPCTSWQQHYAFSTFRRDESWRGSAVKRHEIQPLVDVGRLPEFHYLPYNQVKVLEEYFTQNEERLPTFLHVPDFYLPSRNVCYLMSEKAEILNDSQKLQLVSNLVGVSSEDILKYVKQKEEKKILSEKRTAIKDSFRERPLGQLTMAQLKHIITSLKLSFTREQNNKADLLTLVDGELRKRGLLLEDVF